MAYMFMGRKFVYALHYGPTLARYNLLPIMAMETEPCLTPLPFAAIRLPVLILFGPPCRPVNVVSVSGAGAARVGSGTGGSRTGFGPATTSRSLGIARLDAGSPTMPSNTTTGRRTGKPRFTVYGPFGRVLKEFTIPETETHHASHDAAVKYLYEVRNGGKRAWVEYRSETWR